jgi:hypothetical protein
MSKGAKLCMSLLVCSLTCLLGCSSGAPRPIGVSQQSLTVPAASPIPGHIHDLSRSKFRTGDATKLEVNLPTLQRWHGSLGAFAIDPTNNASSAIPDASSPRGPYLLDVATHNQMVRDYFLGAGLPADQVADIQTLYFASGTGGAGESTKPVLESINSRLTRVVGGVPVIESVAWAKLTTSGDVAMEAVFWPPIDAKIATQAATFAATLADSTQREDFLGKLPGGLSKEGSVVIHHTDASVHATPSAYVSFDIQGPVTRHFDMNGVEFRLPQEQPAEVVPHSARVSRQGSTP